MRILEVVLGENFVIVIVNNWSGVEAPISDHLRDFAPYAEKYKVEQILNM